MIIEVILDALIDSIRLVPFLFLVYLLIEYLDHNKGNSIYHKLMDGRGRGPVLGGLLGCLPQCGFSVVGANLYSKGLIGVGTLLAIFLSTSDEAIPILLVHPEQIGVVFLLLGIKVVFAMVVGVAVSYLLDRKNTAPTLKKQVEAVTEIGEVGCGCHEDCHTPQRVIWECALRHTIKVFAFLVAISALLNFAIEGIGQDTISQLLLVDSIWQPALAALIGLIPNCAASIILTEMYIAGSVGFGSLVAGLCTGAGVGMIVLFKKNKNLKQNLYILGSLYLLGTVFGMLLQLCF